MPDELTEEDMKNMSVEEMEAMLEKYEDKESMVPDPGRKESIFAFFRHILGMKDSWKVGNLTNPELGVTKLGVRHYLQFAQYAETEGLDQVAKYFRHRADIIASTSMSRKGFMPQLFVTQIKAEKKLKTQQLEKKGWFTKKPAEEPEETEQ